MMLLLLTTPIFTDIETKREIVTKEEVGNSTATVLTTTTAPEIHVDMLSKKEVNSNIPASLSKEDPNLNAADDDTNNLNFKSHI
mmetsp:Transcript_18516/g.21225  ORF Transcript_18516/g.21225 Transcript_18516/m.21225 type:complete len:84 (+) Transcript_18516:78-329(+)